MSDPFLDKVRLPALTAGPFSLHVEDVAPFCAVNDVVTLEAEGDVCRVLVNGHERPELARFATRSPPAAGTP